MQSDTKPTSSNNVLEVSNLVTTITLEEGTITPVNNLSFSIPKGKTLGIVGESGCGKSITALSIMGLLPKPQGKIVDGSINFNGEDLCGLKEKYMESIRGKEISMIFQEPMTALNPVFTIGNQISESLRLHLHMSKEEAKERSISLLRKVGIPSPESRFNDYPHNLSGGMRQRAMIAMALSCNPQLLIADEPTTALDVTIQAQILDLMREMQKQLEMAIMFITHDLGVVAETCDEVLVMYAGKVVERASVLDIFKNAKHPYTQGLLTSIPMLNEEREVLDTIKGMVPSLLHLPKGCAFADRCKNVQNRCQEEIPVLESVTANHFVACFNT